jgi:predicted metal-binding membrane protein
MALASLRDDSDRKVFTILTAALILLAWLALRGWGQSPYGRFLNHDHVYDIATPHLALLLAFVAGWTLMTAAMMLPTSLPLITLFRGLVRQRPDRRTLVVLLVSGYLAVWTLFGLLVHLADWGLHHAVMQSRNTWLEAHFCFRCNPWILPAATFLLAGIYQFTPLKRHCLEKCRSPLIFLLEGWRGGQERVRAFRLGVRHGVFCLGCCWSLMLLMFAVGAGNLGWMLALGAVMGLEKNVARARRLSAPLGLLLIGWGVAIVWRSAPLFR